MGEELMVVIVGAGPAGLATAACLNRLSISNIVLEKEDCCASLWKKRSYDRLKLHLAKEFCQLPYMPFPSNAPKFVPRIGFINYLDDYVSHFGINPRYHRAVRFASYNDNIRKWRIEVENMSNNMCEVYIAKFLVVATGENSKPFIPTVPGLDRFEGKFMHSNEYENGLEYEGKNVLVVGCGNSGMEISYDLSNWGANASIVVRSPVHVLTKEIVWIGMKMLKFFPRQMVDMVVVALSKLWYGDMSKFGIHRPKTGPFENKAIIGRTPTIDVGAMEKISKGQIRVFTSIKNIQGTLVEFENSKINQFDVIIFATGYESTVQNWLKEKELFNEKGFPKQDWPYHWKGKNGIYSAGFSKRGLLGISQDSENIANDISITLHQMGQHNYD